MVEQRLCERVVKAVWFGRAPELQANESGELHLVRRRPQSARSRPVGRYGPATFHHLSNAAAVPPTQWNGHVVTVGLTRDVRRAT